MKGLILTHMGKREEGLELVKKGVRLDLTSHIVWHVFGLIQKGEKNYEEALKSYTQALRFDKVSRNRAARERRFRPCSYIPGVSARFGGPSIRCGQLASPCRKPHYFLSPTYLPCRLRPKI